MRHVLLIAALLLAACGPAVTSSYTQEKTEPGVIVQVGYTPDTRRVRTAVGFTSGGNITVTPYSTGEREQFVVVFQCQHGKFVVGRQDTWQKAVEGDSVRIRYSEAVRIYADGTEKVDLDFLDMERVGRARLH